MPALTAGTRAPEVSLPLLSGGKFNLAEALKHGPVLLAFFKISCPVCQMTFPYLERIHKQLGASKLQVVGVSQNDAGSTSGFCKEYGVTFPVVLDDPKTYSVSNAYGITNVPTLFLVSTDGKIEMSSVGWSRPDVQAVADAASKHGAPKPVAVFQKNESIPEFKAG